MRAILKILRNRWFIAALGLIALAVIIWLIGPLIAIAGHEPLASVTARLIAIGLILLLWGLNQLRRYLAARKKNQQMLDSVVGQAEAEATEDFASRESAEELEILRQRLDEAIGILKDSKLGGKHNRQYLYQLPWYLLIGPPGSGKTTALLNSGLHFPLADKLGKNAVQGIGGTRNCDWWFTNDAVLLDTAGRYTTQDSYQEVDSAAWSGFLGLLKKHRKRRPINGVLVAISIDDILRQTGLERQNHAKAIRKRIHELHEQLGIRFPIYVLFTKCDLLAGFSEFFENLGREERRQVWGMTFPLSEKSDTESSIEPFEQEFRALEQRIDQRLVDRLDQERDVKRRTLIYSFPQQFSALREVASAFLGEAFNPSRFEESPMVRGVYFTSGTQEGTPIDRLLGAMAQEFGLDRQIAPAFSGSGRSYFLNRLLTGVVFPEAHLAGINTKVEQRRAWLQRLSYAGAISLALLAAVAWFTSYSRNQSFVDQVALKSAAAQQRIDAVAPDDLQLTSVVTALDAVRQIPGGYAERDEPVPLFMGLGLYQGDKLGEEANSAYFNSLKNLYLPRVILSLEQQLRQRVDNPDFRYEALKVYLMFDDAEHFDADSVRAWMVLDWELNLPGPENAQLRQALLTHLDALLERMPMAPTVPLDQRLVTRVREDLLRVPLAERVYDRIKRATEQSQLPPLRMGSAIGPNADLVFTRASGQPLDTEIPSLFTYQGYHKVFQPEHLTIAKELLGEKWILGPAFDEISGQIDTLALSKQVKQLYYQEYIRIWEQLLNDIRIVPFKGIDQSVEVLNILSGPTSPLRRMLKIVEQETTLARLPEGAAQAAKLTKGITRRMTSKLANILRITQKDLEDQTKGVAITTPVDEHFARLHALIRSSEGEQAPVEQTIALLNELYAHMSSISSAANRSNRAFNAAREQAGGGSNVISRIQLEAKRQPGPLASMLTSVASGSSNLTVSGVKSHIDAVWQTQVLPFFQRSLAGRYPLDRESRTEASIRDFGKFFGPGGMVDDFFNNYLRDFVDTSRKVWRWNASGSRALGIPTRTLRQFQRAAMIRDTFFSDGGRQPKISFDLKPLNMDTSISQITLLLSEQRVSYNHGPTRWNRLDWPDGGGISDAKLLLAPPAGNKPSGISEDGPWGWFRLLDRAKLTPTDSPESIRIDFDVGGRRASFVLRASSALNPFQLKDLEEFRCPKRL